MREYVHEAAQRLDEKMHSDFLSTDPKRIEAGVAALASLSVQGRVPWHAVSEFLEDHVDINPEMPSSYARIYRAVFEVAKKVGKPKYFDGLREIANIVEQNPQMMHPRHILDIAEDYYPNHRIPGYLRQGIIGSLGYALRFFEKTNYEEEITRRLDFDNKERFSRTARFLEIVPALYNVGGEYSYAEDDRIVIKRVQQALREAVEARKGSYLLNVRARLLLEQMESHGFVDAGTERRPFRIGSSRYAWHFEDGIHIAAEEVTQKVERLIAVLDDLEKKITPPQHLVDEALARGENEVMWTPDPKVMSKRKQLYREISALFIEKFQVQAFLDTRAMSSSLIDEDFSDYEYLLRAPTRKIVESEFNVNLSNLNFREQLYFLTYLKTVSAFQVEPVQVFTTLFGNNGLRTFLSMEHDRSMGEKIVELANSKNNKEDIAAIFELYGMIIDATGDAASDEIAHRMGKSARDILARAHQNRDNPEKIRESLQKVSVEGQLLLGTFRALVEEKKVEAVTEISGVKYEEILGSEILGNNTLREPLEVLYRKNYPDKKTQDVLIAEFRKKIHESGAAVHRITFRGAIVAFMLVVPRGEKRLHVSALNVSEELVGVKAGPVLLKKVLDFVQEGNTIEAEATEKLARNYEKLYGFEKVSDTPVEEEDGALVFKLELRPPSTTPSSTAPQIENDGESK